MEKISGVIITQNEEENLLACLESLFFTDEILVCDGGSTDRTVEIAESFGARVVRRDFDDFSSQKNFIIDQAKGPWVLSLDADERVTSELREEIAGLLSSPEPQADGYRIPRKNYFGDRWVRHGGWWPDYNIRFFRKRSGRFVDRRVHERVRIDGRLGTLGGAIEHRTYKDLRDFINRMNSYSTLAAQQDGLEGKRVKPGDMTIRPILAFLKIFLLRRGFLEGSVGFQIAVMHGIYTYAKYAKLREISGKDSHSSGKRSLN